MAVSGLPRTEMNETETETGSGAAKSLGYGQAAHYRGGRGLSLDVLASPGRRGGPVSVCLIMSG